MKIEDKQLIDFYHYNTTNYHDQLLYEKGGSFGYENNIAVSKHPDDVIENIDFHQILPDLSSKRDMSLNNPLDKSEILNLLYNSYRFNNKKSLKSPSPGGIYPLELYLVIQNVKGIEKGVYLYNREKVSLSFINNFHDIYSLNVPSNNFIKNVGCMIFFVCNLNNLTHKYDARAYRYCLIECGHVGQNLSIVSNRLKIKSCAIGGFYDNKVKKVLNLSDNFYPLYSYVLG